MPVDISLLLNDINSSDTATCSKAVEQLSKMGEQAKPAAVGLCRVVGHEEEAIREHAAASLEELGPPAIEDLEELLQLLKANNADTSYWAVTLIGRLQANASKAAPVLAETLGSSAPVFVKQRIAWALSKIGNNSQQVVAALEDAAKSEDARLARNAQRALSSLGH